MHLNFLCLYGQFHMRQNDIMSCGITLKQSLWSYFKTKIDFLSCKLLLLIKRLNKIFKTFFAYFICLFLRDLYILWNSLDLTFANRKKRLMLSYIILILKFNIVFISEKIIYTWMCIRFYGYKQSFFQVKIMNNSLL